MRCLLNTQTDAAFNLAAEEYLFNTCPEDCFMLWQNRNAIIVGRNQNTYSQINPAYVKDHEIQVVRRISGGGAVYQDLGNINFTLVKTHASSLKVDFKTYTRPILDFLNTMGVPAILDGRNDLLVEGRKISGNAQHFHRGKVLHHGTLLFDVNLETMAEALYVDPAKYRDKAVKSVRSRVTNIRPYLADALSVEQFMEQLLARVQRENSGGRGDFSSADSAAISALVKGKYGRWEWNFGKSPGYTFCKTARTAGGTLEIHLDVTAGSIDAIRIFGDYFGVRNIGELEAALIGCPHSRSAVAERIAALPVGDYLQDVPMQELLAAMF